MDRSQSAPALAPPAPGAALERARAAAGMGVNSDRGFTSKILNEGTVKQTEPRKNVGGYIWKYLTCCCC